MVPSIYLQTLLPLVKEMKEAEEEIRRLERVLVKHDASLRKAKAEQMKEAGPAIDKRNSAIVGLCQTWKKRHILHANQAELKKRNVELQDENKKLLLQVQALPSEQSPDSGEGNSRAAEPSVPRLAALPNQLEAAQSPEVESSSSQDQSFDSDEMNNGKGNREEINAVKDLVGRRAIGQSGGGGKVNGLPQGGRGEKEPPKKTVELERPKLVPSPKAKRGPSTPPQGTSRDPESKRKASPLARKSVGREQRDPEPKNISPPLMRKTNVRDPELKRIAPAVSTVAVSPLARKKTDPAPNRRSSPRSLHKDSQPQHEDVPRRSSREGKLTERMRDALTNNKRAAAAPPSPAKAAAKKTASPEVARNRNDFSPPQKRAKLADRNSKKDSPKLKSTEDAEESSPNKTIEETPTSPTAPPPSEKDQSLMDLDLDQEFDTIGSVSSGDFASPSGGGSFFGGGASVAGGDDDEGDDWF